MFCGKCGAEVPAGSRFCNICGAPLASAAPSPAASAPSAPAVTPPRDATGFRAPAPAPGTAVYSDTFVLDVTVTPQQLQRGENVPLRHPALSPGASFRLDPATMQDDSFLVMSPAGTGFHQNFGVRLHVSPSGVHEARPDPLVLDYAVTAQQIRDRMRVAIKHARLPRLAYVTL